MSISIFAGSSIFSIINSRGDPFRYSEHLGLPGWEFWVFMTQASQILENKQLKLVETILSRINKKALVLFINKKLGNPWLYLRRFVVCSVGWMMSHDFGLQVNHYFILSCSVKLFTGSTQLKNDKGQTSDHCLNRWGLPNSSMFWQWYILVVPPWVVSLSPSLSLRWRVSVCETARAGVFKAMR